MRTVLAKISAVFLFASSPLFHGSAQAQVEVAADNAGNYLAGSVNNWTNGANRGFGFQPWNLTNRSTNGGVSGTFIGNPGSAFINTDTNSGGITDPAFGLFAKPIDNNNTVTAKRGLSAPLSIGQTLSLQWAVNWDTEGSGNKGFSIRAGGVDGTELVNVNQGWSANITMNGANAFTNYGTNAMNWSFRRVNANTLQVTATPRDGSSNNFSTNLTISGAPDAMSFYATGLSTNDGDRRQPYFNNFRITGDRITLVGDFLPTKWADSDPANVMTRGGDANSFSLANVRVSNPASIRFKFVNGSFGAANWGLGTNPVTVSTNTGTASGVALREVKDVATATDIVMHRAAGFYTFTFNTNTLAFSVERRTFPALNTFLAAYGVPGSLAGADRDPDGDGLNNQGEYDLNTDPTNDDTDGDGIRDGNEYIFYGTNPLLQDTDGDGLRDDWEIAWKLDTNLDPANPDSDNNGVPDGNEDPDADGLVNLAEQQYNTSPIEKNAVPALFSSVVLAPDNFNRGSVLGWQNRLRKDSNNVNLWTGLVFVSDTNLVTTSRFKFLSYQGTTENSWGKGPIASRAVKDAYQPLDATNLSPTNYFRFQFNVTNGDFTVNPLGAADTNANNLPDAYEQWYGARLSNAATVLDPAADYDGDGLSVAQEFAAGSNPVEDVEAPTLQLIGDEIILVETNVPSFTDPGVLKADQNTNAFNVVTVTTNRARVDQQISNGIPGWNTIFYEATDAAGNKVTNSSRKVVIGSWNASYPSLHYFNLQSVVWDFAQGTGRFRTNSQVRPLDVYAQYFRQGKTEGAARDTNARCWVGLSTNTNHPSSWAEVDWKLADFNSGNIGNNDEYKVTYSNLPANTYRIASRWQFGSNSVYAYGGFNDSGDGGAIGVDSVSGVYQPLSVTVTPATVDYANVQWPPNGEIDTAGTFQIYARVFSAGVTDVSSNAPTYAGFKAQIGYSPANNNPSAAPLLFTWTDVTTGGWHAASGNDDEYVISLSGSVLGGGKFYYASRFSVDGGATWVYGGTKADLKGGGGVWDGTNNINGELTINKLTPTISSAPTASAITLGQALIASSLTGGVAVVGTNNVAGTFAWTDPTFVPSVGTNSLSVTFTPASLALYNPVTTNVTLTVNGASLSFGFNLDGWLSGQTMNPAILGKLAIGGASSATANDGERPVTALDSNKLSLSAIIRTNGPAGLSVVGEAGGSLTNWSTNGVSVTVSTNTNGVPAGHQRQVFSVDRTNSPNRQFLRLKATLTP